MPLEAAALRIRRDDVRWRAAPPHPAGMLGPSPLTVLARANSIYHPLLSSRGGGAPVAPVRPGFRARPARAPSDRPHRISELPGWCHSLSLSRPLVPDRRTRCDARGSHRYLSGAEPRRGAAAAQPRLVRAFVHRVLAPRRERRRRGRGDAAAVHGGGGRRRRAPKRAGMVLHVADLWPDAVIALGAMQNRGRDRRREGDRALRVSPRRRDRGADARARANPRRPAG